MAGWKPIETAPRDGTQILVWDGTVFTCAEFRVLRNGRSGWEIGRSVDGQIAFIHGDISHWLPLPEPPR